MNKKLAKTVSDSVQLFLLMFYFACNEWRFLAHVMTSASARLLFTIRSRTRDAINERSRLPGTELVNFLGLKPQIQLNSANANLTLIASRSFAGV